jgi:L-threonylcarbamoyladenylate synthase
VQWAGLGVAMGNASPTVKQVADLVAPSLEDDGVAWTIATQVLADTLDTEPANVLLSWCSVPELREDLLYGADEPAHIARAGELLQSGHLVAFPTDTVYGIGADARLTDAIYEIYIAKRRSPDKAIPLLISDLEEIRPFVASIPSAARAVIDAFWPGSLTLVLPIAANVPAIISPGPGIAIRMPDHPVALELIRRLGSPIAATSANLSGSRDATTAQAVVEQLGRRIDMVLDGGPTPGAQPSTIVDFTQQPARVLRVGAITLEQLRRYIPELADLTDGRR